jgi:hypothetical protein
MIWLKDVFKVIIVVISAITLEVILGDLFVRVFYLSAKFRSMWGQTGSMISTGIVILVIPVLVAVFIIGLVGGLWINKGPKIGFILAFLFVLPRLFAYMVNIGESKWLLSGLLVLTECLFIIMASSWMYFYVSKRKRRHCGKIP